MTNVTSQTLDLFDKNFLGKGTKMTGLHRLNCSEIKYRWFSVSWFVKICFVLTILNLCFLRCSNLFFLRFKLWKIHIVKFRQGMIVFWSKAGIRFYQHFKMTSLSSWCSITGIIYACWEELSRKKKKDSLPGTKISCSLTVSFCQLNTRVRLA